MPTLSGEHGGPIAVAGPDSHEPAASAGEQEIMTTARGPAALPSGASVGYCEGVTTVHAPRRHGRRSDDREALALRSSPFQTKMPSSLSTIDWLPSMGFLAGATSILNVFGASPGWNPARFAARCDRVMLSRDFLAVSEDLRRAADRIAGAQPRLFDIDKL